MLYYAAAASRHSRLRDAAELSASRRHFHLRQRQDLAGRYAAAAER
jgi:hypothetical protein